MLIRQIRSCFCKGTRATLGRIPQRQDQRAFCPWSSLTIFLVFPLQIKLLDSHADDIPVNERTICGYSYSNIDVEVIHRIRVTINEVERISSEALHVIVVRQLSNRVISCPISSGNDDVITRFRLSQLFQQKTKRWSS